MTTRAATAALLIFLGASSAACTHFEPVRLVPRGASATLPTALKPGDTVEVLDRGQRRRRFVVTSVDAQAIQGEGVRVAMEDVEAVSIRRLGPALPGSSRGGPWGVFGALLGAAAAVLIAIAIL